MATWGDILSELKDPQNLRDDGTPDSDKVRRKYLAALYKLTRRPVIVYSSGWLDKETNSGNHQIVLGDLQGFMNSCAGVSERELDLILNSPGGSPNAAESILSYLRTQFDHIRVIVPVAAMSAATMIALGADEIVMGAHSQLGPIDPQFVIQTPEGPRMSPGQAILDQFRQAKEECAKNPQSVVAWMPILRSYLPGLLKQIEDEQDIARLRVEAWLKRYMFKNTEGGDDKAKNAAEWFANYDYFGSHGRRVSITDARKLGLNVVELEADPELQDAVLSVHHCYSLTHANAAVVKIIENHLGKAYVKSEQTAQIIQGSPVPSPATKKGPMSAQGE